MPARTPKESEMLPAVIALFGASYEPITEAKFSRKKIDVLFMPKEDGPWISVELKICNWKTALWQAAVNTSVADRSYVALWVSSLERALAKKDLFESYGVGIICVSENGASFILHGEQRANRTREQQQRIMRDEQPARRKRLDPTSLLPA